jgi:hypothetical protein
MASTSTKSTTKRFIDRIQSGDESEDNRDRKSASRGPKRKVTNEQTQADSEEDYGVIRRPKSGRGSRGGRQGRGTSTGRAEAWRRRKECDRSDNVNDEDDEDEIPDIIHRRK